MILDHIGMSADALLAYSAYFVGTASPGPSNLSIRSIAMHTGRRPAIVFAAGVISGSLFWAVLAALGLSAALTRYSSLLFMIKIFGGLYLLWLAFRSARSAWQHHPSGRVPAVAQRHESAPRVYLRGLGLHLTNPKAILAWISIVSLALPSGASTSHALSVVAGCMCIGIVVFGGYAVLFSTASARRIYGAICRWLEGVLAVVFAVAGLKLLLSRT
ncbi:MAG: LysE family translocator [Rhodoferax sp.]|nr:LysE family translocator [Rhodoferax sp.]